MNTPGYKMLKMLLLGVMVLQLGSNMGAEVATSAELKSYGKSSDAPIPLIWDDDGSPDGVIALLYFLQHPGVDVKAITVSCGLAHPDIFAQNLQRMLSQLGKADIPVAAGRSMPLAGNNAFPEAWRSNTDDFWQIQLPELETKRVPASAARLIVDVVNRSPVPVTIFVSGTHTNLVEALRLDSGIAAKIRTIEVMGGALRVPGNVRSEAVNQHEPVSEWNIWIDPQAAKEVFESGIPINLTPLDATQDVIWKKSDADHWKRMKTPGGLLAANLLEWMLQRMSPDGVYVWDLVAAVIATIPALCEQQPLNVRVVTKSGDQQGRTLVDNTALPNAKVCILPDEDAMRKHVSAVFGQP